MESKEVNVASKTTCLAKCHVDIKDEKNTQDTGIPLLTLERIGSERKEWKSCVDKESTRMSLGVYN